MQKAGRGSIINISSTNARRAVPGLSTYITAKAGLEGMTRALAVEGGESGIRANCIIVGTVPTGGPSWEPALADPAFARALEEVQITGVGTPQNIAAAAVFLASDEAAFVTGACVPVEGGAMAKLALPDTRLVREAE